MVAVVGEDVDEFVFGDFESFREEVHGGAGGLVGDDPVDIGEGEVLFFEEGVEVGREESGGFEVELASIHFKEELVVVAFAIIVAGEDGAAARDAAFRGELTIGGELAAEVFYGKSLVALEEVGDGTIAEETVAFW